MNIINICGKRGLGDIISGISFVLQNIQADSHLIFHLPKNFDYPNTIRILMKEFELPYSHSVTHEVCEDWSSVSLQKAIQKFGKDGQNESWFFLDCNGKQQYMPFKTKWNGNKNGPIALSINNENTNPNYPYPEKFFDTKTNSILESFIDEKKYLFLGRPYTIEENIKKLSECRYAIGIDGAWTHAAHAMGVPYFLVRNQMNLELLESVHFSHPSLKIIETHEIFKYLII